MSPLFTSNPLVNVTSDYNLNIQTTSGLYGRSFHKRKSKRDIFDKQKTTGNYLLLEQNFLSGIANYSRAFDL